MGRYWDIETAKTGYPVCSDVRYYENHLIRLNHKELYELKLEVDRALYRIQQTLERRLWHEIGR